MSSVRCVLELQGYRSCGIVVRVGNEYLRPCQAGILVSSNEIYRLIYDIVLSRPEDYLSIYQSMCNHRCLKCHSWYFAQEPAGTWYSPRDVLQEVIKYREMVTVWEPRDRATMWHASDLCAHCGMCITTGRPGPYCPRVLKPHQILLSPQGFGPARNIVSFTGGDLYCNPAFYIKTFKLIKKEVPDMWIHIETNGYGLTPKNLDALRAAGLDSIWLDLKAYYEDTYMNLCGTTNEWVLKVPELTKDLGLVLEIVILYIPGMVEHDQMEKFAELIKGVDPDIPVTLLAFFPQHLMLNYRSPTFEEMVHAYKIFKRYGIRNVKIGNVGVFCKNKECTDRLIDLVGRSAVSL